MYTQTQRVFQVLLFLVVLSWGAFPHRAVSQQGPRGSVSLYGWPQALHTAPADTTFPFALLPSIEHLSLDYEYGEDAGQPALRLALSWEQGNVGVLEGRRVPSSALPDDVRIEHLSLRALVVADGQVQAAVLFALDSLMLGPVPDQLTLETEQLEWETLFADLSSEEARQLVDNGFELQSLEIEHITFAVFEPAPEVAVSRGSTRPPRRVYRSYPIDIHIHAGWFFDLSRRRRVIQVVRDTERPIRAKRPASTATTEDRERDISRTAGNTGRTVERGNADTESAENPTRRTNGRERGRSKRDDDDNDDDGEASLLPYAIGAVAAVGTLVVVGGTVGVYGNTKNAPLGLTAGYVQPQGGFLLQAAINEAVLGQSSGPERLTAKITSFYNFFDAPVQPALGLGVLATARDDITWEPTVTLGLAGNFGSLVVLGGYDVGQGGAEFSVAYNFRARRRQ